MAGRSSRLAGGTPAVASAPAGSAEETVLRLAHLPHDHPCRPAARHAAIEANLPLVHHLARRFTGRGEPYDDLVQVGTIGLLNAVDRFDPERGSFTAFAVPTILGEIRRHFRDRGWALRVPRRLQDLARRVSEAREVLTQRLGRSPTVQELATHLDIEPDLVLEALETAGVYATVPMPTSAEGVELELPMVEEDYDTIEVRATLQPLLANLPPRERRILVLRFVRNLSQSQIAAEVGLSQMHVSRLIARSLATLRRSLNPQDLS
ncbi:MAG: SigB/SigF/SigG family RNA polymerase sigma factor [Kineosporiaceae bacterium]